MNALSLDTVVLADNKKEMIILDQTLLPGEIKYLTLSKDVYKRQAGGLIQNKGADLWEERLL